MIKSFKLIFPTLKHEGEVSFDKGNRTGARKNTSIFSLDWSKKEPKLQETIPNAMKHITFKDLPDKWDEYVKSRIFAIPVNYLDEIHHHSQQAASEWNRSPLSFDTMMRDICISPAKGHVTAAFKLLWDCVYDVETEYYSRNFLDQLTLDHLMIYKFWSGQTGRGLLWKNAEMDEIEFILNDKFNWKDGENESDHKTSTLQGLLDDMRHHEEEREKKYEEYGICVRV